VVVCEAGGLLKHAYFPQSSVLSLLTVLENGSAIETANIGREGAFGLFAAMYSRVSFNRCLVQLEGAMVRCPIELLQAEFKNSEQVRDLFVSYSETQLSQVQQTVACNAMHSTEERMCRWPLVMQDRAEGEVLAYAHVHFVCSRSRCIAVEKRSTSTKSQIGVTLGRRWRARRGLRTLGCNNFDPDRLAFRPARAANENWCSDHAVINATKDQLKAMPAFKYSKYN